MAIANVFSGSINSFFPTSPSAVASGSALTAANLLGGINVDGTGAGNVTLPSGASLGAAVFGRINVGDTFTFTNVSTTAGGSTIATGGAAWTLVGSMLAAATVGSAATFRIRCTAVPTDSAGAGATFTIYRAS